MLPDILFLGLSLYDVLIAVGIFLCILIFSKLADKKKLSGKLQNTVLIFAIVTIIGGFGIATLTQSFYDYLANKSAGFNLTGSTFYGGFVGAVIIFLILYLGVGHIIFKDNYHLKHIFDIMNTAVCSVTLAHGFGRLGCLMAGCCHGKATDSFLGITMLDADTNTWGKFIPVQLYEAIFLFLLCAFLIFRLLKHKNYNFSVYLIGYGVWRFIAEYFRGDNRGSTIVSFLSPSQLTAIILVVIGVAVIFIERHFIGKMQKCAVDEVLSKTEETRACESDNTEQTQVEPTESEKTSSEDDDDKS